MDDVTRSITIARRKEAFSLRGLPEEKEGTLHGPLLEGLTAFRNGFSHQKKHSVFNHLVRHSIGSPKGKFAGTHPAPQGTVDTVRQ